MLNFVTPIPTTIWKKDDKNSYTKPWKSHERLVSETPGSSAIMWTSAKLVLLWTSSNVNIPFSLNVLKIGKDIHGVYTNYMIQWQVTARPRTTLWHQKETWKSMRAWQNSPFPLNSKKIWRFCRHYARNSFFTFWHMVEEIAALELSGEEKSLGALTVSCHGCTSFERLHFSMQPLLNSLQLHSCQGKNEQRVDSLGQEESQQRRLSDMSPDNLHCQCYLRFGRHMLHVHSWIRAILRLQGKFRLLLSTELVFSACKVELEWKRILVPVRKMGWILVARVTFSPCR